MLVYADSQMCIYLHKYLAKEWVTPPFEPPVKERTATDGTAEKIP